MSKVTLTQYRNAAYRIYHSEGDVEIDTGAKVSRSKGGAYVQAWVWVTSVSAKDDPKEKSF